MRWHLQALRGNGAALRSTRAARTARFALFDDRAVERLQLHMPDFAFLLPDCD